MSERRIIKLELDAGLLLFSTGIELAVFTFEATVPESESDTTGRLSLFILKVGRILALCIRIFAC